MAGNSWLFFFFFPFGTFLHNVWVADLVGIDNGVYSQYFRPFVSFQCFNLQGTDEYSAVYFLLAARDVRICSLYFFTGVLATSSAHYNLSDHL